MYQKIVNNLVFWNIKVLRKIINLLSKIKIKQYSLKQGSVAFYKKSNFLRANCIEKSYTGCSYFKTVVFL